MNDQWKKLRKEAWKVLKGQTLVGEVEYVSRKGDVFLTSAIPLLHEMEAEPFTNIFGGRPHISCHAGDRVAFTLKEVREERWPTGEKRPPVAEESSWRVIDEKEYDSIVATVLPLIKPYLDAEPSTRLIEQIPEHLEALNELQSSIEEALLERDRVIAQSEELARSRSEEILRDAEMEAAEKRGEHNKKSKLLDSEVQKLIDDHVQLEQQREIFRAEGGERFVRALGFSYRDKERAMTIVERPDDLLLEVERELIRIGMDLPPKAVRRMLTANVLAAMTGQIVLYVGPPGSGKSTSGILIPTLLGMEASVIPVRPGWLDATDMLGYFDPRNGRFISAPFVDLVVNAKVDCELGRFHVVVLDEMNLARIENYGADLISQLEKSHERDRVGKLRLYSPAVEREIDANKLRDSEPAMRFTEIPAEMTIPNNLIVAGTINNDESTEALSQKVIDRCVTVRVPRIEPKPRLNHGLPPATIFTLSREVIDLSVAEIKNDDETVKENWSRISSLLNGQEIPGLQDALSQRFARAIVHAPAVSRVLGIEIHHVVDDIMSMKILPWIRYFRSEKPRADDGLRDLASQASELRFSDFAEEIQSMLANADDLVHYIR